MLVNIKGNPVNTSKSSKDAFPNERTARKNTDKKIIINVDFVMQTVLSGKHLVYMTQF